MEAFQRLCERPYCIFLDSSDLLPEEGRISVLATDPLEIQTSWSELRRVPTRAVDGCLPFVGGWMGYLAYEAYAEFIPQVPVRETSEPSLAFGFYDTFLCFDHAAQQAWVASLGLTDPAGASDEALARRKIDELKQRLVTPSVKGAAPVLCSRSATEGRSSAPTGDLQATISRTCYDEHIAIIQDYIRAGDCYQINYTQCFAGQTELSAPELYQRLRQLSPAPYAAYLNWESFQVLSASPEAFLEIDGSRVTTRPIKGTRPRAQDPEMDAQQRRELLASPKDHAELLMITDLERNDLGKVCQAGSVQTVKLRELRQLAQVYHLYSVIEGDLRPDVGPWQVVEACFPGGSITGAPKIRAMQIIRELESHERGVYTGAIGYVAVDGSSRFNIPIRTLRYQQGKLQVYAGGGIVADSDADAEYEEAWVKTKGIREALSEVI